MERTGETREMKNAARIRNLELDIEQLRRALANPNMAASQRGSPENKGALGRIEKHQKRIETLRSKT